MKMEMRKRFAVGLASGFFVLLAFLPMAAQASVLAEIESNDTIATAQNIDGAFSLDFSPNIGDRTTNTSTTIPHVTIQGSGDETMDFYGFTTLGGLAIFDIDFAGSFLGGVPDSSLTLLDSVGNILDYVDDNHITFGQEGSVDFYDPYLETTLAPGNYFIWVESHLGLPVELGTYELQVSIGNRGTVPEPTSMLLTGMGLLGLAGFCKKWSR